MLNSQFLPLGSVPLRDNNSNNDSSSSSSSSNIGNIGNKNTNSTNDTKNSNTPKISDPSSTNDTGTGLAGGTQQGVADAAIAGNDDKSASDAATTKDTPHGPKHTQSKRKTKHQKRPAPAPLSRPSVMSPKSKPADSDLENPNPKSNGKGNHPVADTAPDIGGVPRTAAIPATTAATFTATDVHSSHPKPFHQQQFSHMPYSSYPSHVFSQMNSSTAGPLGIGQFPQLAHNFTNVYPAPGTSVSANYSSFPRLNSISEDTAYHFGSRRNSILHNVDMQSNPSIDMSIFPSSFHHISSTPTNGNTITGSGDFSIASSGSTTNNNNNNNNTNGNANNAKVVFNSIPSTNSSIPLLYGNTMYANAPSQYGLFDPSVHDYLRDYSLSSNNNSLARNSSSNVAMGQSFSGLGMMMQPFNPDKYLNSTATDHLISTRRSSEQSDLYLGSKAQLPAKPISAPSTNLSSINSSSRNGTSNSITSNVSNIPNHNNFQTSSPAHSMIPSATNSRQGSFFFRKFPSTVHLPDDLSPADLDSFLKRDSTGIQEIFDPLQTGALDQSSDTASHGKLPEPQAKSRANSIFQLSFPSRASTSSLSHLFGATSSQQTPYPPPVAITPQPQPQPENDTQSSPQDQSKTSQIPQHSAPQRQPQTPQGSTLSATAPLHNIKQPHQFMLQHQVYPHLFVQQQQQYQQLQMQQMQLSQQHLYSQHQQQQQYQPHQPQQLLQHHPQHQTSPQQAKSSTPLSTQVQEALESKKDEIDVDSNSSRKRKRNEKSELNQENISSQEHKDDSAKRNIAKKIKGSSGIQSKNPQNAKQIKVKNKRGLDEYEEKKLIKSNSSLKRDDGRPLVGATKVDQLMLIIQARQKGVCGNIEQSEDGNIDEENILPNPIELVGGVEKTSLKGDKSHQCKYCQKKFTQSTHLDVHLRSHMGVKPYKCEFCDKRFTQGGNLRTHMRLHTGEKPFKCDICDKQFSRKGNLQAHLLTHDNSKPFICKFDGCNKGFTQLGNLKAHQNRFHLDTINELFNKLAQLGEGIGSYDSLPESEKELLDYFSSLYKNLNKGIKGRGKARKETSEPEQ